MESVTSSTAVATAVCANDITLFASLELSKSKWVVTINSPGSDHRPLTRKTGVARHREYTAAAGRAAVTWVTHRTNVDALANGQLLWPNFRKASA